MMTTCCAVLGLVMLVLTNLSAIISFATPYWIRSGSNLSRGLWAYCDANYCAWVFRDFHPDMEDQTSSWWRATQGLMCIGLGLALFALLVATVMLCCECKGCNCSLMVAGFLIITALVLAVAATVFGICANYYINVQLDGPKHFSWSFWLAVAASTLALFTSIVYAMEGRNRDHYHSRC